MNLISVVIPCFNEEHNIFPLYKRLKKVLDSYTHELIFVNDGSTDSTGKIIKDLKKEDSSVKVVLHTENLGHEKANYSGILNCKGDAVVVIDADLQDPPELIIDFIKKWKEDYKVVYGIRINRKYEKPLKALLGYIYYILLKVLTYSRVPFNVGDYCLIDKIVIEKIKKAKKEKELFRSHVHSFKVKSIGIKFQRSKRMEGQSHYTLYKLIILGLKSILANIRISLIIILIIGILGVIFFL